MRCHRCHVKRAGEKSATERSDLPHRGQRKLLLRFRSQMRSHTRYKTRDAGQKPYREANHGEEGAADAEGDDAKKGHRECGLPPPRRRGAPRQIAPVSRGPRRPVCALRCRACLLGSRCASMSGGKLWSAGYPSASRFSGRISGRDPRIRARSDLSRLWHSHDTGRASTDQVRRPVRLP